MANRKEGEGRGGYRGGECNVVHVYLPICVARGRYTV